MPRRRKSRGCVPPIEDMTRCLPIALGLSSGSTMASAAEAKRMAGRCGGQPVFRYELTNLEFRGVEMSATPDGFAADTLRFLCDDFKCILRRVDDYDETIKAIAVLNLSTSGSSHALSVRCNSFQNF